MAEDIIGSKKGAGGGKFYEADNTLQSTATVRVLEVISEGPIKGLVGGAKGIYLNNVPVEYEDGAKNFGGKVAWDQRVGLPSQPYMEGFTSAAAEVPVNTEATTASPVTYTASAVDIDAMRVTVGLPQGLALNDTSKNRLVGSEVELSIERRLGSDPWVEVKRFKITGKTTNAYEETHRVERPVGEGLWSVRLIRHTEDNASATLHNNTWFNRVTELKNVSEEYPDTAYVGIAVDANTVGSSRIPTRSYLADGVMVKLPSNFDPYTRQYTGLWDGTFKLDWTDDPAWHLYDLLSHPRYGLGRFGMTESQIDKYSFYNASVYNSELVNDGEGGQEPRFTFNYVLGRRQDAAQWLDTIAGAMNAKLIWIGDKATVVQDRPASPVKLITKSNVVDGKFLYKSSSLQERVTVVNVTWNDPANHYQQAVTTVEADEAYITRYGYNSKDIAAVGTTAEGQAIRAGKWVLDTSLNQREIVSFKQFLNGFDLIPGDIVKLFDEDYAGAQQAGRLLTGSTASVLQLDREVALTPGSTIDLRTADGTLETRSIAQTGGSLSVVNLTEPLSFTPEEYTDYIVTTSLAPRQFKIMKVTLDDDSQVSVEALEHDPTKYNRIENGISIPAPVFSAVPSRQVSAPVGLLFREVSVNEDNTIKRALHVSWQQPTTGVVTKYIFKYQVNSGGWTTVETSAPAVDIQAIPGLYEVTVVAVGFDGTVGDAATGSYTLSVTGGGASTLDAPTSLVDVTSGGTTFSGIDLNVKWTNPASNEQVQSATLRDFEVRVLSASDTLLRTEYVPAVPAGLQQTYSYTYGKNLEDGGPRRDVKIEVRCRDANNNLSTAAFAAFSNPPPLVPSDLAIQGGVGSNKITYALPVEPDFSGVLVWRSTSSGFTPSASNLAYDTTSSYVADNSLTAGTTYYYVVAAYDTFGKSDSGTGLNLSSEVSATPVGIGIAKGETNPASGEEGDLFFNTTDDKLYRYTGEQWTAAVPTVDLTGQITTTQITDDSVTADKLTANSVTADKLAANSVTTDKLVANSVTTGKLAASAVTANELAAESVTADKMVANAVTADKVAADAIEARHMKIGGGRGAALNRDPTGTDATAWNKAQGNGTWTSVVVSDGPAGKNALSVVSDTEIYDVIPCTPGKTYRLTAWVKVVDNPAGTNRLYLRLRFMDVNESELQFTVLHIDGGYNLEALNPPVGEWVKYVGTATAPAGAKTCRLNAHVNWAGSGTTQIQDFRVEEQIDFSLIVTGGIKAYNIDSRGLSIKDASGNVILASGSAVDFSKLGGAAANLAALDYRPFEIVPSAGVLVEGDMLTKVSASGLWDAGAYSRDAYYGGAYCSFTWDAWSTGFMVGLNEDANADHNYTGLDFAWYISGSDAQARYNGTTILNSTTRSAGDLFTVIYDGSKVQWLKNGNVIYELINGVRPAMRLFFDCSIATSGGRISKVRFGPYGQASAQGRNLMDSSWWSVGLVPTTDGWNANNTGDGTTDALPSGIGPSGQQEILWRCIAGSGGQGAGGWNTGHTGKGYGNYFLVDHKKTYRFAVPIKKYSGTGQSFWGIQANSVCNLNTTTPNANPYFGSKTLTSGKWYLFVGYVFPSGTTGHTNAGAGIYDMETGALVQTGTNWNWSATTRAAGTRCYFYYASAGAVQFMGRPMVHLLDGSEPTLDSLLASGSPSGRNPITSTNVGTYLSTGVITNAYIGSVIQSTNYSAGTAGWVINKDGTAEFHNVLVRGNVQATSVNAASGTLGTITAGYLRNAANTTYINLNATGTQTFISANNGAFWITADGKSRIIRTIASGTWNGVIGPSSTTVKTIGFDTGIRKAHGALAADNIVARVSNVTFTFSDGEVPARPGGTYVGDLEIFVRPIIRRPYFVSPYQELGQNPYGAGQEALFLWVDVIIKNPVAGFYNGTITSISWTLDVVG